MRLQASETSTIRTVVQHIAGQQAKAWLYGSRLDDTRRGGDVDLLVQSSPTISLMQRARIKILLEEQLGLPVDVIACEDGEPASAFARIALLQGVQL